MLKVGQEVSMKHPPLTKGGEVLIEEGTVIQITEKYIAVERLDNTYGQQTVFRFGLDGKGLNFWYWPNRRPTNAFLSNDDFDWDYDYLPWNTPGGFRYISKVNGWITIDPDRPLWELVDEEKANGPA